MNVRTQHISDEQLSAFLDAELPDAEMELIRQHLAEDESLANRLAELAMVDNLVGKSYAQIDSRPLPRAVTELLANDNKSVNVIEFSLWRKFNDHIQKNIAIAASVVILLGFGIMHMLQNGPATSNGMSNWQSVAQILETTPSGINRDLTNDIQVKPQLTFMSKHNEYCRQFQVRDHKDITENIACRKNNQWQLVAGTQSKENQDANTYQTASGGSALDSVIDEMASGGFFDAQAESSAISSHWLTAGSPVKNKAVAE